VDFNEFYTENREYKIRIKKEKRVYSLTNYSNYKISIEFIDSINRTIFTINTNEKELFTALQELEGFLSTDIISDNIYFENNGDFSGYFLYISKEPIESISDTDYEDILDTEEIHLCFFHNTNQGNSLRLYFKASYNYLYDFIYYLFTILDDIPYLSEISYSNILEYLKGE
jgi:hypothetical protein